MSPILAGVVGIVVLVLALLAGIPIGVAMFLVGLAGLSYLSSLDAALRLMSMQILSSFSSYDFAVVLCFAVMGSLAGYSGASGRLYDCAYRFLGRLPGGLAVATTGACAFFGAICGSAGAAAATFGRVALPEMKKHNYSLSMATGCVAAGGTLSILIPPSLVFIIYGVIANQSVGILFISGVIPGIIATALMMLTVLLVCLKDPALGPAGSASTFKEKLRSVPGVVDALILFVIILGGMFAGIFTPTEGGAVGAIGMAAIALVRRSLSFKGLLASFRETAQIIGMIFMIITGALVFGRFIAITKVASALADLMISLQWPPNVTFLCFIVPIYFIAGCFMEMLAVVLITVPLFLPLITRLGFDPIWFGVQIVLLSMIGMLTPPVGIAVYVVKSVAPDVPLPVIFRGAIWFVPALLVCAALVLIFPELALWLPRMMTR
jgi:C4-dicarboxylate transporter, DctM subunit